MELGARLTLSCILRLMTSDQLQPRPGPGLRLLLAKSRQCSPLHKVHSSLQLSPSRAKQPRARMQSLPQCLIVLLWLGTDCLMPSDHCLIFLNSLKVMVRTREKFFLLVKENQWFSWPPYPPIWMVMFHILDCRSDKMFMYAILERGHPMSVAVRDSGSEWDTELMRDIKRKHPGPRMSECWVRRDKLSHTHTARAGGPSLDIMHTILSHIPTSHHKQGTSLISAKYTSTVPTIVSTL